MVSAARARGPREASDCDREVAAADRSRRIWLHDLGLEASTTEKRKHMKP
jgi:hypothetical protein